MIPLTKILFVSSIETIRLQLSKDIAYAEAVSSIFNTDSIGPYDTSLLVKQLIRHLQLFFPKDERGFCEIEHYCFDLNFGKIGDQELIRPEDLWDRLYSVHYMPCSALVNRKEPLISTHPLIDDQQRSRFVFDVVIKGK